jgi:hypothetical protein
MTPAEIEAVAQRVAELLRPELARLGDQAPLADGLVDAQALGRLLGVSRDFVYRHAEQLGAVRLGTGGRGRLRFDPAAARAGMGRLPAPTAPPVRRQRRTRTTGDLLPIKDRR